MRLPSRPRAALSQWKNVLDWAGLDVTGGGEYHEDAYFDPERRQRRSLKLVDCPLPEIESEQENAVMRLWGDMNGSDRAVSELLLTDGGEISPRKIILAKSAVNETSIQDELEALFRDQARALFEDLVAEHADEMGVEYEGLAVRNQRTRWGSCSPKQNLSFNWRLIMAPPEIAEYVVVHELAHLKEKNHTKRFWRIVRNELPDYHERVNWLENHSVELIFTDEDL